MSDFVLSAMRVALAVTSVFVTPLLLVRCILPSIGSVSLLALAGAVSITVGSFVPVTLHLLAVPLTPWSLSTIHLVLFVAAAIALRLRHIGILPNDISTLRIPALLCLSGILLLIPLTPLAGIDTYKWQDLATVVQVEERIPWLIHPAALLGFAPRAYPCAQPLTLATVQTLGDLGVESGYFLISCLSIVTAIFAAYRLGLALFTNNLALWFAAFYVFAPVAMRYHHWATGRGFFLAVLPLFVLGLLGRTWRHAILAAGAAVLLSLTHKTAVVAVPVLVMGLQLVPGLRRSWRIPLALASAAVAAIFAGGSFVPSAGGILSALRLATTRLGILAPLLVLAVFLPDRAEQAGTLDSTREKRCRQVLTLLLLLFPIAFTADMYGALLLLPIATVSAVHGLHMSRIQWPNLARATALPIAAILAAGALAIVLNRDMNATPRRIREAAVFLDRYDPNGPFRIVAPDRVQGRMQAYVRGCPRFRVGVAHAKAESGVRAFPSFRSPRAFVAGVTAYLRNALEPSDLVTDWYGQPVAVYHVLVDGKGDTPKDAALIYDRNGVKIFQTREASAIRENRESL